MNIFTMTSLSKKSNIFASDATFLCRPVGGMLYSSHCPYNPNICWHHHHAILFTLEFHKSMSLTYDDRYNFFPLTNKDREEDFDARYYYHPHG